MGHKIYISRAGRGLGMPDAYKLIRAAARETLKTQGISGPCEIAVLLTNDEGILRINREFRGIDSATDVLSFPQNMLKPGSFEPDACVRDMDTGRVLLGDMVISLERVVKQGKALGHGSQRELCYLAVHSVLHLLGYDHLDEAQEKTKMREREKLVCRNLGLEG